MEIYLDDIVGENDFDYEERSKNITIFVISAHLFTLQGRKTQCNGIP